MEQTPEWSKWLGGILAVGVVAVIVPLVIVGIGVFLVVCFVSVVANNR